MRIKVIIVVTLIAALLLFGCKRKELIYEKIANHTNVVEDSSYGRIEMSFDILDGENVRSFETKPGITYNFDYDYNINEGDIKIIFTDSEKNTLAQTEWSSEIEKKLKKSECSTAILWGHGGNKKIESTDSEIRIVIFGKEASGSVKVEW